MEVPKSLVLQDIMSKLWLHKNEKSHDNINKKMQELNKENTPLFHFMVMRKTHHIFL